MRQHTRVPIALLIFLKLVFPHPAHSDDQIRQKIGQMIIVGFEGTSVPDSVRVDLAGRNLGGVVLLRRNCIAPLQIQQRNSQIRSLAQTRPFIAVNQEGGSVARRVRIGGIDQVAGPTA